MATVNLPYTKVSKGHVYFRITSRGKHTYIRLPDPSSPSFATEYQKQLRLMEAGKRPDTDGPKPGSFAALIKEYRASAKYGELKKSSRDNTDFFHNLIEQRFGTKPVRLLSHRTIDKLQDEMKETPGKANKYISVLSVLLDMGVRRGYCDKNVAAGTPRLKTGEHDPWPENVIEEALAWCLDRKRPHYALGIITGLCSGQRVSDCVRMNDAMISDGLMALRQQKTGKEVFIPMHPIWVEARESLPKHATIMFDGRGRPYTTEGVQAFIRRLMKDLGHVDEDGQALYTFHGLRKNATNILASIGCTPHEISAITGMSLQMVIHYTRAIQMKLVAERIADRYRKAALPGVVTGAKNSGNAETV